MGERVDEKEGWRVSGGGCEGNVEWEAIKGGKLTERKSGLVWMSGSEWK